MDRRTEGATSHYNNHEICNRKVLYWQDGYGVVSFGTKDLPWVVSYVRNQKRHHAEGRTVDRLERTERPEAPPPDSASRTSRARLTRRTKPLKRALARVGDRIRRPTSPRRAAYEPACGGEGAEAARAARRAYAFDPRGARPACTAACSQQLRPRRFRHRTLTNHSGKRLPIGPVHGAFPTPPGSRRRGDVGRDRIA